ncbi:H-NS histone family protein [Roseicyclus marinus]|uniref:H-NS histone family protein n=1 Tax=Roseicyclus marinus TaxID=2161673 RepID=UPI0024107691|nr:H-NS histone family protein [Roseicyclus marinus]MDG3040518.1 H-NS histone family protein [Roseicyclus marinus]
MSQPNLDTMSLAELQDLQKKIAVAIHTFEQRRIAEARAKLEATARELGVSLEDIMGGSAKGKTKGRSGPTGAPKFRHPENPALTWTGRGRRPTWFIEVVEAGISEESMKV